MEYRSMLRLPRTARRRLARAALASLGLATIMVPLLWLPASDPAAGPSPWWVVGVALWFSSLALLAAALLFGGRLSRPILFHGFEKAAALPAVLIALFGGIWMLREGLGASSTTAFAIGLAVGLIALPLGIRLRAKWMRQEIHRGHLKGALNLETATWDPRHEVDQWLKDPRFSRPNCLLSLLFWCGPALGLALVDIFGRLTAAVIAGALAAGYGYSMVMVAITDLVVLALELRRLERGLGRRILLPPEFSRGEQPQAT